MADPTGFFQSAYNPAGKERPRFHRRTPSAALLLLAPLDPFTGDWENAGGNAGRDGSTAELGPEAATLLWSGGKPSVIAWQPVTEGGRLFVVRQTSFVPSGVPNDAPIVA